MQRPLGTTGTVCAFILAAGLCSAEAPKFPQKPFELGAAVSYSAGLVTPWMRAYQAPGIEITARLFGRAEIEAFLLTDASLLVAGAEARVSPQAGAWMPFVGVGYFYARGGSGALSENHATYLSGGLLRFSLEDLAIAGPESTHRLFVSILEFRLGPFIAPGARWIFSTGNFLAGVDLIKMGVFF